jgi:hypothetical protein
MRINISNKINSFKVGDPRVFDPVGPRPPGINSLLDVQQFEASRTLVAPFEDFTLNWVIVAKQPDVVVENYDIRLSFDPYGNSTLSQTFEATDTVQTSIWQDRRLTLQAKLKTENNWRSLNPPVQMQIDQSECLALELPVSLLLQQMATELDDAISSILVLRRKGDLTYSNRIDHLEIKAPLEIVLNNFFNGDFDITFRLSMRADIASNNDCNLSVELDSSQNANFHWLEDILSGGVSATIAKTVERLVPYILAPILTQAERAILEGFCVFIDIGNLLDTHTLFDVNLQTPGKITFVLCDTSP